MFFPICNSSATPIGGRCTAYFKNIADMNGTAGWYERTYGSVGDIHFELIRRSGVRHELQYFGATLDLMVQHSNQGTYESAARLCIES